MGGDPLDRAERVAVAKLRREIRRAVADYMASGDGEELGRLLNVPRYPDGSGRNWSAYRTPTE